MTSIRRAAAIAVALTLAACGGDDARGDASGGGGGAGDAFIVAYVEDDPPGFVVHDAATGDVSWRADGRVDTPMFGFGDTLVWVLPGRDALIGIDLASGERTWRREVGNAVVSVAPGDDEMIVLTRTEASAVEADSGDVRWAFAGDAFDGARMSADGDQVMLADGSVHTLLAADDGTVVWQRDTGHSVALAGGGMPYVQGRIQAGTAESLSPLTLGDGIAVLSSWGGDEVVGVDLDDGSERWRLEMSNAVAAPFADSVVVVSEDGALAVEPATGDVIWSYEFGDELTGGALSAVLHGDLLVVVGAEGGLLGLEAGDGTARWQRPGAHRFVSTAGGTLAALVDGVPTGIDAETGTALWTGETGSGQVVVLELRGADGVVVVGEATGPEMRALDVDDGEQRWTASATDWWEGG